MKQKLEREKEEEQEHYHHQQQHQQDFNHDNCQDQYDYYHQNHHHEQQYTEQQVCLSNTSSELHENPSQSSSKEDMYYSGPMDLSSPSVNYSDGLSSPERLRTNWIFSSNEIPSGFKTISGEYNFDHLFNIYTTLCRKKCKITVQFNC